MTDWQQQILRTDMAGCPMEWVDFREAVKLACLEQIGYTLGPTVFTVHGGINRAGQRSEISVNAIIATFGHTPASRGTQAYIPPLSNNALFKRDRHLCLYCGQSFHKRDLSRDHVRPRRFGGEDHWNNVVTACKRCNNVKADRTPEQADMQLLAIPFTPTRAEYVYLQGKRILADQMDFLLAHFPRNSPLRERASSERH
jgi:5-methylcytosine-specific restriction endonuclease McrA